MLRFLCSARIKHSHMHQHPIFIPFCTAVAVGSNYLTDSIMHKQIICKTCLRNFTPLIRNFLASTDEQETSCCCCCCCCCCLFVCLFVDLWYQQYAEGRRFKSFRNPLSSYPQNTAFPRLTRLGYVWLN